MAQWRTRAEALEAEIDGAHAIIDREEALREQRRAQAPSEMRMVELDTTNVVVLSEHRVRPAVTRGGL